MSSDKKLTKILAIVVAVKEHEWEHAHRCRHQFCPINECPEQDCDPIHAIYKILEAP